MRRGNGALNRMRINIDFSPREHVYARKVYLALAVCILAAASAFTASYGAYSLAESKTAPLKAKVSALEARKAGLEKETAAIKKTVDPARAAEDAKQVNFVNGAIARRAFSWTAFLNRMEELVPPGVGVTTVKPEFSTYTVEMAGTAENMDVLMEFVGRLTKSQYFEDIPPVFQTAETVADKDIGKTVQQFSLRIQYFPDGRKGAPAGPAAPEGAAATEGPEEGAPEKASTDAGASKP